MPTTIACNAQNMMTGIAMDKSHFDLLGLVVFSFAVTYICSNSMHPNLHGSPGLESEGKKIVKRQWLDCALTDVRYKTIPLTLTSDYALMCGQRGRSAHMFVLAIVCMHIIPSQKIALGHAPCVFSATPSKYSF